LFNDVQYLEQSGQEKLLQSDDRIQISGAFAELCVLCRSKTRQLLARVSKSSRSALRICILARTEISARWGNIRASRRHKYDAADCRNGCRANKEIAGG